MKKLLTIISAVILFASCNTVKQANNTLIPRAINTINSVTMQELNLSKSDYKIINTVQAEACIKYHRNRRGTQITISDEHDEFKLFYQLSKNNDWQCSYQGIMRFGYLANDYSVNNNNFIQPEEIARRLAIYRLINLVNEYGADGVLEPVISTSIETKGDHDVFYTTVRAKMVVVKTDKK